MIPSNPDTRTLLVSLFSAVIAVITTIIFERRARRRETEDQIDVAVHATIGRHFSTILDAHDRFATKMQDIADEVSLVGDRASEAGKSVDALLLTLADRERMLSATLQERLGLIQEAAENADRTVAHLNSARLKAQRDHIVLLAMARTLNNALFPDLTDDYAHDFMNRIRSILSEFGGSFIGGGHNHDSEENDSGRLLSLVWASDAIELWVGTSLMLEEPRASEWANSAMTQRVRGGSHSKKRQYIIVVDGSVTHDDIPEVVGAAKIPVIAISDLRSYMIAEAPLTPQ